jgi:hypothetical protein
VLAAVSVTDLDDKHVNSEQVTDHENANSKQQEIETGERVEYQEPFHRSISRFFWMLDSQSLAAPNTRRSLRPVAQAVRAALEVENIGCWMTPRDVQAVVPTPDRSPRRSVKPACCC